LKNKKLNLRKKRLKRVKN